MLEGATSSGRPRRLRQDAAFGLPIIDTSTRASRGAALILTPTRELCIQDAGDPRLRAAQGRDVVAVFGGAPIRTQQAQLKAGGHIVVGTVGRVLDLISRHSLVLDSCRFVVLDEADEMLDLGFLEDVEKILRLTPNSRQTALFSATMPPPIRKLADNYLYDPEHVKVQSATLTVDSVEQSGAGEDRRQGESSSRCSKPSGPTRRSLRATRRSAPTSSTRNETRLNVRRCRRHVARMRDGACSASRRQRAILVSNDVAAAAWTSRPSRTS